MSRSDCDTEIAQAAAPWVLEHGLSYGQAKRKAREALQWPERTPLPTHAQLEDALQEHIALYLSDSQPHELLAMRDLTLTWMHQLAEFRPYVCGSVWNGLATANQGICLQLFADEPKLVDIALLNHGIRFELDEQTGVGGTPVPALLLEAFCTPLGQTLPLLLIVHDADDIKRARRSDERGRPLRGDAQALKARMADPSAPAG